MKYTAGIRSRLTELGQPVCAKAKTSENLWLACSAVVIICFVCFYISRYALLSLLPCVARPVWIVWLACYHRNPVSKPWCGVHYLVSETLLSLGGIIFHKMVHQKQQYTLHTSPSHNNNRQWLYTTRRARTCKHVQCNVTKLAPVLLPASNIEYGN